MRCPKCHYLSFDPEPRCKNCGYDLEVADADLALKAGEPVAEAPVLDLKLRDRAPAPAPTPITLELRRKPARPAASRKSVARKEVAASHLTVIEEPEDEAPSDVPEIQLRETTEVPEHDEHDEWDADSTDSVVEVADAPPAPIAAAVSAPPPPEPVPVPSPAALSLVPEPPALAAPSRPMAAVGAVKVLEPRSFEPRQAVPRPPEPLPPAPRAPHTTTEMPLFVKGIPDRAIDELPDEDTMARPQLLDVPPAPRPLGVRRTAPEPPRGPQKMGERRLGPLDRDLLEDLKRVEREEAAKLQADARALGAALAATEDGDVVEPVHRLAAGAVDAGILGSIAAFVVWATLRLCQVELSGLGFAALVPLVFFLVVVDLSYLLMFTAAGGQTVGKMLMGIRVVPDEDADSAHVSFRQAAWRALLTLLSVVPLGAGWLPALFGKGVALHDRFAHTRVVRA